MLAKPEFDKNLFLWRTAAAVTVVSGLFSVLVFLLLVLNYLQVQRADPIDDPTLTNLRQEYAAAPERDEALAQRIRELDLLTRKAFFTSQNQLRIGGILLLAGVAVFLVAFKNMARWKPELPQLSDPPAAEEEWAAVATSRRIIGWLSVAVLAAGLLSAYLTESLVAPAPPELAQTPPGEETATVASPGSAPERTYPTWEEIEVNWPSFRGPGGAGVAHFTNIPTRWNVETGEGVRWVTELPRVAANSPVIWGNRLFLSAADENTREMFCYDTETGKLLWTHGLTPFPGTPAQPPKVTEDTGYAAPTMVAHGDRVCAIFANGDVACLDFEGNPVWGRNLGVPVNHYGYASSLIAYENLLLVQYDQNEGGKAMALDMDTGKTVWTAAREKISWASPIIARTPLGDQLMLCSEKQVDAYDPVSGALLWSEECLGGEVAPSPAYRDGVVFVANEYATATAIKLGGTADAVEPAVLWEWDELLPEVASPVGDGKHFYIATSMGDLLSLDARTGEEAWTEMFDDGFYSSPILVGDRLYVADMGGTIHIVGTGDTYQEIATPSMGAPVYATPAYLDGRLYVRTEKHLYCIENRGDKTSQTESRPPTIPAQARILNRPEEAAVCGRG